MYPWILVMAGLVFGVDYLLRRKKWKDNSKEEKISLIVNMFSVGPYVFLSVLGALWTSEDGVEFANANEATTTFVMPDKNVTVTANYEAVSVVETFTVIYTDGVNRAEIFEDLIFEDLLYGEATPEFDGVPVREGYRFNGWSPAVEAIVTGDVTYTTTWTETGSGDNGGGSYTPTGPKVTVTDGENGDVTVSSDSAGEGSTVTIIVTPDEGYILGDLIVTDEEGNVIEVTDKGDGEYTFEMPASEVSVEVTFVKDDLSRFVDVPADSYYYDAVLWAVKQGITNGTDETHFSPDLSCTRAQAVTFLWRAAGCPEPVSKEMPFTDVQEDSYYYDVVLWAVENGITNGTSATTFGPDAKCTRAQIVTFLMRALKSQADGTDNPFSDVDSASYYTDAVLWAVEQGITNGTSETTFSPDADCTRAQIVTFLYRALGGK